MAPLFVNAYLPTIELDIALFLSVIVDDFDFHRTSVGPDETHPPLVVDANAVLTGTVAAQRFETMRWRRSQVG